MSRNSPLKYFLNQLLKEPEQDPKQQAIELIGPESKDIRSKKLFKSKSKQLKSAGAFMGILSLIYYSNLKNIFFGRTLSEYVYIITFIAGLIGCVIGYKIMTNLMKEDELPIWNIPNDYLFNKVVWSFGVGLFSSCIIHFFLGTFVF